MKVTISGLILMASTFVSVFASPVANNSAEGKHLDARAIHKRASRTNLKGYRNFGRVWYFDSQPTTVFVSRLRYRPSNFYGQRFEYCYQNNPDFKQYWDTDITFRQSWDQDIHFRNSWFAILYPYGYDEYRNGGKYYGYYSRGRYGKSRWSYNRNRGAGRNGGSWGNNGGNRGNNGGNRGNNGG
ncbi:hypothetical protein AYI70_g700, partial [Smittium culicis]